MTATLDISKLRALHEKATQGPWRWWDRKSGRPANYDLSKLIGADGYHVISTYGGAGFEGLGKKPEDMANAALIAYVRTHLPEIIERLERQ